MWAFEEMLASRKHLDTLSYIYRIALSYRRPLCIARPLYFPLVLGLVELKNPPKSSSPLLLCRSTVPLSLVSGGLRMAQNRQSVTFCWDLLSIMMAMTLP